MFDCVQPDEFCLREVIVHVASHHTDRSKGFNENNPGMGLRIQKPEDSVSMVFGGYRNSIRRDSFYAGMGYDLLEAGPLFARVEIVAITGYAVPLTVAPLPEIGFRFAGYALAINYVPHMYVRGFEVSEVYGFSLQKRF